MCSTVATDRLRYEASTGELFWVKAAKNKRHLIGKRAGTIERNGYWHVRIDGVSYSQHRLIWLMFTDAWPKMVIDHIDGNKLNNRIENLRDVDQWTNSVNKHRPRIDSTSGAVGVEQRPNGRWGAYISCRGKKFSLGTHDSIEMASAAYSAAKEVHHKETRHV